MSGVFYNRTVIGVVISIVVTVFVVWMRAARKYRKYPMRLK